MNIIKRNNLISPILILIIAVSCVPATRFKALEEQYKSVCRENENLIEKNENLNLKKMELDSFVKALNNQIEYLEKDTLQKLNELKNIKSQVENLKKNIADLKSNQEKILKGKDLESAQLMNRLQTTEDELRKKEQVLEEKRKNLEKLSIELNQKNARVNELESRILTNDSIMNSLKTKISNALIGFVNNGLTLKVKDGKVYLSMDEKLLFPSGSIDIDKKGKEALRDLAKVLVQNPDINVMIEGHTDNVPYKSSTPNGIKDNWDLSVQRATSIVRLLTENANIDPKRIIASGRGEYMPLVSNSNAESRQRNRRIEIILAPNLDEVMKLLEPKK